MIATPPFIPGHEATGTVVLAGPDSTVQVRKWNQNCLSILISNFALYLYLDKVSMKPDFGKAFFSKIEQFWEIAKSVSILFNQTASFVSSVRSSSGYHGLIEIRNPLFQIFQILQILK